MRSLKFFGCCLLLLALSSAVHAAEDYYLNEVQKFKHYNGFKIFNFEQYDSDSIEEKEANGITPEDQRVLDFVTGIYKDIRVGADSEDPPDIFDDAHLATIAVLGQLENIATAIVGHNYDYPNWDEDQYLAMSMSEPGSAALAGLKSTLDELAGDDWDTDTAEPLKEAANDLLLKINADVNQLDEDAAIDPAKGGLAAILSGLSIIGVESADSSAEHSDQQGGYIAKLTSYFKSWYQWASGNAEESAEINANQTVVSEGSACNRHRNRRMLLGGCVETDSDIADGMSSGTLTSGPITSGDDPIILEKAGDIGGTGGIMEKAGDNSGTGGMMEAGGIGTGDMITFGGVEAAGGSSEAP